MQTSPDKIRVLLDTDIGSDIDDAVALAYLLKQARCELLGITTVTGDVAQRAAMAQILCEAVGRAGIPVRAGISRPLQWGCGQPAVPQYEAVKHRPHRLDRKEGEAIEFLRQTIRAHPGEITLLSIGPFTNIAKLFEADPEIPSLLARFVSMAGCFFGPGPHLEWNCRVDPLATARVYRATARASGKHVSIGLDVTRQCRLAAGEVRSRFTASPLDIVLEMAGPWFEKHDQITFHDPLAAALIFEPGLCGYQAGRIEIDEGPDEKTEGTSTFVQSQNGPHTAADQVEAARFFEHYFGVFR